MQFNLKILSVLFLLLAMTSVAFACEVEIDNLIVELRGNDDYDTSIVVEKNTDIDVKVEFDVLSRSGGDCPSNLKVEIKSLRYNESTSQWSQIEIDSKTATLSVKDDYSISFSNEFNTGSNSNYTQFKVETTVFVVTEELGSEEAIVDVENTSCDAIDLIASSFSLNENATSTKVVTIRNNSNYDFRIESADISSSSSLVRSADVEYSQYVYSDSDEELDLIIQTGSVSSNTSTTLVLSVAGYLGNTYCSATTIGKKNITMTVNNSSSSDDDDDDSTSSSDCDDIDIQTRSTEFDESTTQKLVFGIKNNSTKRFEVLSIDSYSSGFSLSKYFNEKYIFSGQTGDLILNAQFPSVSQNRLLQGTVKVRGIFSDGRSCSFTDIGTKTFDVNVIDLQNNSLNPNCSGFNISVPESINVENYGELAFTITNNSNRTAKIIVEGSIDVTPTVIVLPRNSSLSRIINVQINSPTGFVKFTPTIEGCIVNSKTVEIRNNVSGEVTNVVMSATNVDRDYELNIVTLEIKVDNPTNRVFNGNLVIDSPNGWPDIQRNITILPGANAFTEKLGTSGNFEEGVIKVSFTSQGKTISALANTDEQNNSLLVGLFAFGGSLGGIGIILIIILVVIIIVGMMDYSPNTKATTDQEWVNEKN